jgi:uncharacterized protein YidB (DUF937 family)
MDGTGSVSSAELNEALGGLNLVESTPATAKKADTSQTKSAVSVAKFLPALAELLTNIGHSPDGNSASAVYERFLAALSGNVR